MCVCMCVSVVYVCVCECVCISIFSILSFIGSILRRTAVFVNM